MSDCIIWTGALTVAGYGVKRVDGKTEYLHRLAYIAAHGSVPEGLELDHLCRNRACYNVEHLEAVTHAENMRRGHFGSKTECPEGHPYDEENTIINSINGGRQCRTCKNSRRRKGKPRSKTHCPQGHPKIAENKLSGGSGCKPCHRVASAAYKARQKARLA